MRIQETPRQKKIAAALQRELSTLIQEAVRKQGVTNLVLSITKVSVTADLSLAKIYLSIFPKDKAKNTLRGFRRMLFRLTMIWRLE